MLSVSNGENQMALLKTIVSDYIKILKKNLIGIYLHGSLAMNGFNHKISDIDFLVVINDPIIKETKSELINTLVQLDHLAPEKGFEMSVLLLKDTMNFTYPTPFQLHYSSDHKEKFIKQGELCEGGTDPDLAAHIRVLNHRGKCLYGKAIHAVFGRVPEKDYLNAILYDVEDAKTMLSKEPTYFVLNLCRTLYYLEEGLIGSKLEGGNWALENVPKRYRPIVQKAMDEYRTGEKYTLDNIESLSMFVNELLSKIRDIIIRKPYI